VKKSPEGVNVSIMGREFAVACADEQRDALSQAAMHLDIKMREIQKSGKIIGMEKCAIMAALNITHELLSAQAKQGESDKISATVASILNKLDIAMQEQAQLSIQSSH